MKPFPPIKSFHPLAAVAIDEFVQIWVVQSLIDCPKTRLGTLEGTLRVKLPAAHVANGEYHTPTAQNISLDDFAVLPRRDAKDHFLRKRGNLERAEDVGAQRREMTESQSPDF